MREFTKNELLILWELLDGKGYSNQQIAKSLKKQDSNTNPIIRDLEKYNVIYSGQHRKTSNPKSKRPNQPEKPYFLMVNIEIFNSLIVQCAIFKDEYDKMLERLLSSKYTNLIIQTNGIVAVFNSVEQHLKNPILHKSVSRILLHQEAVEETYLRIFEYIRDYLSGKDINKYDIVDEIKQRKTFSRPIWSTVSSKDYSEYILWEELGDQRGNALKKMRSNMGGISSRHLDILAHFDPYESVDFYRKNVDMDFLGLFSEFEAKSVITHGLHQFLNYDGYLSPLTAYPINNPKNLLFSKPFQRIYDDFYLLERDDLSYLDERANSIYDNFADFLFEHFRNVPPKSESTLEEQTRQMIFQWNISSANFDAVRLYLESLYGTKEGSGKFHVQGDGIALSIIDLETFKQVPDLVENKLYFESKPIIIYKAWEDSAEEMTNPFDCLKPCYYSSAPVRTPDSFISASQILIDLKDKFSEYDWNY